MSVLAVAPEARNRITLKHEGNEDGKAAGENEGSDHSDASSKFAPDEDAPVKEKDPDLDNCHSERPEHHEDVEILN